ncbi:zinc ribbon domain-containing protein [Micromonospora sp. NPDC007271]|uniref:zinc ribbon domain-containing protein n=1 Tax=Micromonospora sp. NPDC007271 TaxID=3154587 RepID=UPI0034052F83
MKVTRVAYSMELNPGKYAALLEQARRLGRVRSEVWQRYGAVAGVGSGLRDRLVRDRWLADGTHVQFGVLANVPGNAAYTSQTCHRCGRFGRRSGDRFHCTSCGVVWQADVNAAINILHRAGDPDIALHTPHFVVKQILQDRTDRHRTRLPVQDSSPVTAERRAKYPNRSAMSTEKQEMP